MAFLDQQTADEAKKRLDALAAEVGETLLEADRDGAAAEEILAFNVAGLNEVGVAFDDLGDSGDYPDVHEAGPLEEEVELAEKLLRCARNGYDRLVRRSTPEQVDDVADGSEDGDALDLIAYLDRVVVEEGDDHPEYGLFLDFPGYRPAGEARADYIDPTALTFEVAHGCLRLRS